MNVITTIGWAGAMTLAALFDAGCRQCGASETGPARFGVVFSTDTLGAGKGFRRAEVATAYLVRYTSANFTQPIDTARALPTGNYFYYVDHRWFCNFPVTGSEPPRSYRLEMPAASRRYDIADIVLQYGDVENCSRTISRLDALINGQRVDVRRDGTLTK